ncbi:hypothetical protein JB92DRAFT_990739 [Gautieria morchelliformis]|nr:hypothetical protein JB92DRAFT_990739 [Gautieria morchelliformis]
MASLQERQQMLLDDPDISVVEPHRVFCNRCDKWLKLNQTKLYAASVWRSHRNTKSHNMRPPNATAPAPHLLKDGKIIGPTNQRSTEELQFIIDNPSTASAPAALPTMLSLGGDTMPQGVEPDHQSANLSAQTVAAFNYYRTEAQSNEPPSPHHGQPNMSQKSMHPPPPPPPPAAQKPPLLPVARSNFLGSPVQSAGQPRAPSTPHHITRARAISISAKDGVIPSAIMPTSRATAFSLERLSPHRKASYKALMGEHYIGELEPFRAFCTLCHRWVDLSSRTPYSYGVWKGHVRKTDKQ